MIEHDFDQYSGNWISFIPSMSLIDFFAVPPRDITFLITQE